MAGTWTGTTSGFGAGQNLAYASRLVLSQDGTSASGTYTINNSVLPVTGMVAGSRLVLTGTDTATRTLELDASGNSMSGTESYSVPGGGGFEVSVSLSR